MATYGADTARWFMLSDSPPERDVEWTERGVQGAWRFVQRLWRLVGEAAEIAEAAPADAAGRRSASRRWRCARPPTARSPRSPTRSRGCTSTSRVAHIYEFANALGVGHRPKPAATPDFAWAVREAADILVRLFHPMMPHLAEECWAALGHNTLVADEPWPKVEPALLVENTITLPVQVNGKKRADVTVAARRHKRRDRGCRAGARCGTTGARRQAPEEGHRRPAEDRECGGMNAARRSPASPAWLLALALAGLLAGCFEPLYGEQDAGRRPGLRQRLSAVDVDPIRRPSGTPEARIAVEMRNDLIFDLTGGVGASAPTHELNDPAATQNQQVIVDITTARADVAAVRHQRQLSR